MSTCQKNSILICFSGFRHGHILAFVGTWGQMGGSLKMLRCCCRNFFIQFPEITVINFKQFNIPDFFNQFPELFEIVKASVDPSRDFHLLTWPLPDLQNACRFIRYHFGPEHLGRLGKQCASDGFFLLADNMYPVEIRNADYNRPTKKTRGHLNQQMWALDML